MEDENKFYEEIQKREREEVAKMSEEEKELFYQFKKDFTDEFLKNMKKELKLKNNEINKEEQKECEESLQKAIECVDFIELYYIKRKEAEINIYLETIFENCSVNKEVHNLAYELNNEYRVLWDNLKPSSKDKIVKTWAIGKIANGVDKFRLGVVTLGISALIEKGIKNKEMEKYREYVTSDGFTSMCKDVNKYLENNKED